jgi:hypothetical protein
MLNEEELTKENLSNRIKKGEILLDNSINNLKKFIEDKNKEFPIEKNNNVLYDLAVEWRELVELAKMRPDLPLSQRAISYWKLNLFPKLKEYDGLIKLWNKTHSAKIRTIEERIGFPLKEEIYGSKYFNY